MFIHKTKAYIMLFAQALDNSYTNNVHVVSTPFGHSTTPNYLYSCESFASVDSAIVPSPKVRA